MRLPIPLPFRALPFGAKSQAVPRRGRLALYRSLPQFRWLRRHRRHSISENHNSCYQEWSRSSAPRQTTNSLGWCGGKASAPRRQRRKKRNSLIFGCKPLISLKTAKENPWKKFGNPWKKLGKVCKTLGKAWNSWEKFARRASARPSCPFRRLGADPSQRRSEAVRVG